MIVILGDVHFSSTKDYFIRISEEVIKWFSSWELNNEDNELILVGDLVYSSINAGLVIEYLYRFIEASRFNKIHITKGNHDEKLKDGVWQLAYSFLYYKDNVSIYEKAEIVEIQRHRVMMLPHYIARGSQLPMAELYSSIHEDAVWRELFSEEKAPVDLVVGHFADESVSYLSPEAVKNLHKIPTEIICLGHVHIRGSSPRFIGSLFANRIGENAEDRAAWLIEDKKKREYPLPKFSEFLYVRYPSPLPPSTALVPIYTVMNCATESVARALYGDIYIRKVMQDIAKSETILDSSLLNFSAADLEEMFKDFSREQQPPLDRRVAQTCLPLVKNSTKSRDGTRTHTEPIL